MLDFAGSELNMTSAVAQREREVRAATRHAGLVSAPHRLRAALAAKLATLAFRLDADTIQSMIAGDSRVAGHRG